MIPRAYYNENDAHAAAWLRELIARKLIMDGEVDERSITDVSPDDLATFTRCHFFAGLGLWDHALRLAGWPKDRPVWTGSCPCQPFSIAGKGLGEEDERHLWPVFRDLIDARQPPVAFGEQVASKDGRTWLAGVFADLEGMGYQRAGADLCAAGIGSPHIRQRLYWVANADHQRRVGINPLLQRQTSGREPQDILEASGGGPNSRVAEPEGQQPHGSRDTRGGRGEPSDDRRVGDARGEGREGHCWDGDGGGEPGWIGSQPVGSTAEAGDTGGGLGHPASGGLGVIGNASQPGSGGRVDSPSDDCRMANPNGLHGDGTGPCAGDDGRQHGSPAAPRGESDIPRYDWQDTYWHPCRDGKHRRVPVEPEFFPLADAGIYVVPGMARRRTVRPPLLRGSGNAIVPQVAATFISAFLEA